MELSAVHIGLVLLIGWLTLKFFRRGHDQFEPDLMVKQKNVLVTGASSGIGRATALKFAELGANVYITARSEGKLKDVVEKCKEIGAVGAVHGYVTGDVGDPEQAERVVKESAEALGGLDFLMLHHVHQDIDNFDMYKYTAEDFKRLKKAFDVNFFSYVTMASAAMKYFRKSGGKVAAISSIAGRKADILLAIYAATKHALEGFFRSLDLENHFLETNVSFTIVDLGVIGTKKEDTKDAMAIITKRVKGYGIDLMKMFSSYNAPADLDKTVSEIIRATALREPETYFPKDYSLWWQVVKAHLFPHTLRKATQYLRLPK